MGIPGIQTCSAFRHDVAPVCCRFLPGNRTYKEVICPSDKTNGRERKGEEGLLEGRHLLSLAAAFRISESHPLLPGCIPAVPFASLLFPIVLTAFCVQLRLPPKTVKPKYQPEN